MSPRAFASGWRCSSRFRYVPSACIAIFFCSLSPLRFCRSPLIAAPNESAQDQVAAAIKAPNVSVVHLWAPWCSNCQAELKSGGWSKIVKDNPEVKFYFVSVWDKGDDGRAILAKK